MQVHLPDLEPLTYFNLFLPIFKLNTEESPSELTQHSISKSLENIGISEGGQSTFTSLGQLSSLAPSLWGIHMYISSMYICIYFPILFFVDLTI